MDVLQIARKKFFAGKVIKLFFVRKISKLKINLFLSEHFRIPDSVKVITQMLSSNSDLIDKNTISEFHVWLLSSKNNSRFKFQLFYFYLVHRKNCSPLPEKCCCSFKDPFNICPVFCKFILAANPGGKYSFKETRLKTHSLTKFFYSDCCRFRSTVSFKCPTQSSTQG